MAHMGFHWCFGLEKCITEALSICRNQLFCAHSADEVVWKKCQWFQTSFKYFFDWWSTYLLAWLMVSQSFSLPQNVWTTFLIMTANLQLSRDNVKTILQLLKIAGSSAWHLVEDHVLTLMHHVLSWQIQDTVVSRILNTWHAVLTPAKYVRKVRNATVHSLFISGARILFRKNIS